MLNRAFITKTTSGELGFRNRKSTRDDLLLTDVGVRFPYSDILCLVLDSYLTFRLLILQKVKTAHKTLTSPSVTLRKLSTVLWVSKFLLRQRYLNLGSDNFSNRIRTAIRSYEENFFYCNKLLCNVIEISFQERDDKNIWKR